MQHQTERFVGEKQDRVGRCARKIEDYRRSIAGRLVTMMLKKCSIKESGIHGLGCYTDEPIAKGEVVWIFDPRIDIEISHEEYLDLPVAARAYYDVYGYFTETSSGVRVVLCGDHSKHMNHSDDPNLLDTEDENIALRDIEAGEELTCNYRRFDIKARSKLGEA